MDEKEKYEKVWAECSRYGKDWTDRGLGRPYKVPFLKEVPRGSTVFDFGCGNGSSLSWMKSQSFYPLGVEIAANATLPRYSNDVFLADLRDTQALDIIGKAQYGLCTDLMEHIPTDDVDLVLENISEHISIGVMFGIARLPDLDGVSLGLELHLTIADRDWWDEKLLRYFSQVQEVRYDDGCYIVWGWK